MWPSRGSDARKSSFQSILHHQNFQVTNLQTYLRTQPPIESPILFIVSIFQAILGLPWGCTWVPCHKCLLWMGWTNDSSSSILFRRHWWCHGSARGCHICIFAGMLRSLDSLLLSQKTLHAKEGLKMCILIFCSENVNLLLCSFDLFVIHTPHHV